MNLFIDTPQRAAARLDRTRTQAAHPQAAPSAPEDPGTSAAAARPVMGYAPWARYAPAGSYRDDLDEAPGYEGALGGKAARPARIPRPARQNPPQRPEEAPDIACDAYREDKAYDRARKRRARRMRALRMLIACLLVPIAVVLVFLGSYALTCIVNGATPEELAGLMGNLFNRVSGFFTAMLSGWGEADVL